MVTRLTVDEAVERVGSGPYLYLLLVVLGLAWVFDGLEVMLLSLLGPALKCDWNLSPEGEAMISMVVFIGMGIGAYSFGALADSYGRKASILTSITLLFASAMLSAWSPTYGWMLLFRGIVGISIGGVPVAFSLFSEVVPSKHRGRWGSVLQGFWPVGSVGAAALAWAVMPVMGWRMYLVIAAAPILLLLVLFFFVYESPRYLFDKVSPEAALQVLQAMAKQNGTLHLLQDVQLIGYGEKARIEAESSYAADPTTTGTTTSTSTSTSTPTPTSTTSSTPTPTSHSPSSPRPTSPPSAPPITTTTTTTTASADATLTTPITQSPSSPSPARRSMRLVAGCCRASEWDVRRWKIVTTLQEILSPEHRRTTLLLWFVWFANALTYYGVVLFASQEAVENKHCGHKKNIPPLTAKDYQTLMITACADFPGIFLPAFFADRVGRRWTQGVSFALTAVCFVFLIVFKDNSDGHVAMGFLARVFILSAFTICYLWTPETVKTHLRGSAFGIANGFGRIGGILAPFVGQALLARGEKTAAEVIFMCVCIVACVGTFLIKVETAGKSLDAAAEAAEEHQTETLASASSSATSDFEQVLKDREEEDDDGEGVLSHTSQGGVSLATITP